MAKLVRINTGFARPTIIVETYGNKPAYLSTGRLSMPEEKWVQGMDGQGRQWRVPTSYIVEEATGGDSPKA
jgi:hypothetical protein